MRQTRALMVPGPAGQIEASYNEPTESDGTIVLCHPHPQYGGNMHDAVLGTIADVAGRLGIAQLKFNFRGVGASAGVFDRGIGEVDDLLAVLEWLRSEVRPTSIRLAGYSFGSSVAWRAIDRAGELEHILFVAPPVAMMDFPPRPTLATPIGLICGDEDSFVAAPDLVRWAAEGAPNAILSTIAGADHFFGGAHVALDAAVERILTAEP
jgi:alpha/beta superfamily hydrolase